MIDAILKMFTPSKKQNALDYATEALNKVDEEVVFQLSDPPGWAERMEREATRQECVHIMEQTISWADRLIKAEHDLRQDSSCLSRMNYEDLYTMADELSFNAMVLMDSIIGLNDSKLECKELDPLGEDGIWSFLDVEDIETSLAMSIPSYASEDDLLALFWPSLFGGFNDDLHLL